MFCRSAAAHTTSATEGSPARDLPAIAGEFLVSPNGTVDLGRYGQFTVRGIDGRVAKIAVEEQLTNFLQNRRFHLSVFAGNSKVYYVICEARPEIMTRLPFEYDETFDAIATDEWLAPVGEQEHLDRPTHTRLQRSRHHFARALARG